RSAQGAFAGSVRPSTRQTIRQNIGAGFRAVGAGLGALTPLAPVAGIAALTALWGKVNSETDKARQALADLESEIKRENAQLDFTNEDVLRNRIANLEARAREARRELGGWWSRTWRSLMGIQDEAELILAEAQALRLGPETTEDYRKILDSDVILEKLSKSVFPGFEDELSELRR